LDPSIRHKTQDIVDALVGDWNDGTKDNYLHKFEVFLDWLAARGETIFASISPVTLLQFVLFLLDEKPHGQRRGIAPASVF
jgi:hypothetical protein